MSLNDLSGMDAAPNSDLKPLKIVVASLTFRRPEGISKLLNSLVSQIHEPNRPYDLTIVVIDNDPAGSAEASINYYHGNPSFNLIYQIEQEPGIPFARNRALDEAPGNTDLFCFLDDDEWVVENWIDAMLTVREKTGADCVYGPIEPIYPPDCSDYFIKAGVFERKKNSDCDRLTYAASNNVMFDYRKFRDLGLRFEERMRFTGGTDYLFFNQAVQKGVKIYWSSDALVYDIIPAERMTWKWVLQRQYRLGNTFAVAEVLHGNLQSRVIRAAYGAARAILGLILLPGFVISPRLGARALTHLLRGLGMVNGIFGHSYQEYGRNEKVEPGRG